MLRGPDRDCYVKALFTGPLNDTCYEQVSMRMTRQDADAMAASLQAAKDRGEAPHVKAIQVARLRLAI